MLKKFPVKSSKGNKYLVNVWYEDRFDIGRTLFDLGRTLEVRLYIEEKYRNIFGKKKSKIILVKKYFFGEKEPEYQNSVEAVRQVIRLYEEHLQKEENEQSKQKALLLKAKSEFENWDGQC